jgi:hypothetical protein
MAVDEWVSTAIGVAMVMMMMMMIIGDSEG